MTEFEGICQQLHSKESLTLIGKLLDLKQKTLIDTLLKENDKDKVWDIKQQISFINSFSREIGYKSNIKSDILD